MREGRLTHELLWATWMRVELGVETEGGIALDMLLGWAALDGRGQTFTRGGSANPVFNRGGSTNPVGNHDAGGVPKLRDALLAVLDRALGPAGPVVWGPGSREKEAALLEYAVLFESLAKSADPAVRIWVKQRFGPGSG